MTPSPESSSVPASGGNSAPRFRYTAALAGEIELRWQAEWERRGTFRQPNPGEAGFDGTKPKFYCLDMFPYPSGAGLHVGHPEGYTATDMVCRLKRMQGFNVLHPMGWDAFGLPAEQYAIATGVHPAITTKEAIDNFRRQLKRFGFCYDWSREFGTIDPEYYRWTQWIFLRLYGSWFDPRLKQARPISELVSRLEIGELGVSAAGEVVRLHSPSASGLPVAQATGLCEEGRRDKAGETPVPPHQEKRTGETPVPPPEGVRDWNSLAPDEQRHIIDSKRLAYLGEQTVNWCPKLGTALANDEVIDGKSERGGYPVLRKPLRQWMLRITAYAQRLLDGLQGLDWPSSTRTMQEEWIGRSEGAEIEFEVVGGLEAGYQGDSALGGTALQSGDSSARAPGTCLEQNATNQGRNWSVRGLSAPGPAADLTPPRLVRCASFVPRDPFPPGEPLPRDLDGFVRNLPHLELPGATYFVTWRTKPGIELDERERLEVLQSMVFDHGVKYDVFAAVVMPDHVHWVVRPRANIVLGDLVASIKKFSARRLNLARHSSGAMWQDERFDHILRDEAWLSHAINYVLWNPVEAGLASRPSEYWSCVLGWELTVEGQSLAWHPGAALESGSTERRDTALESGATKEGTLRVFTTRPDTLFGATYMVVAPEHPLIDEAMARAGDATRRALGEYVAWARNRSDVERQESRDKTGCFTGLFAINPGTGERIPIWTADYVLMGYGFGAIMAVPAHDERDFEFAEKFALPIRDVVYPRQTLAMQYFGLHATPEERRPERFAAVLADFLGWVNSQDVPPEKFAEALATVRSRRAADAPGAVIHTHVGEPMTGRAGESGERRGVVQSTWLDTIEAFGFTTHEALRERFERAALASEGPQRGPYSGAGFSANSAGPELSINGLPTSEAKEAVMAWLERTGRGGRKVNFRLRDWVFSRQRYWGEPFPIVFDADGRAHPVSEAALPVTLPALADYAPVESDEPQPLLAKAREWTHLTAREAGVTTLPPEAPVVRETNTMPGSAGSSWYFLRYCDARNGGRFASREAEQYWMGGQRETQGSGGTGVPPVQNEGSSAASREQGSGGTGVPPVQNEGSSAASREQGSGGTGVPPVQNEGSSAASREQGSGGTGVPPVLGDSTFARTHRNLPHWTLDGATYFITFRVRSGWLTPEERRVVLGAIRHWHGPRCRVHLACVMPDHVHLVLTPQRTGGEWQPLSKIMHSIKSFSAHAIQKQRGGQGSLWQDESFDRLIRDESEFREKLNYIMKNPVHAGLAPEPWAYEFLVAFELESGERTFQRLNAPAQGGSASNVDPHRRDACATGAEETHRRDACATGAEETHRRDACATGAEETHRRDACATGAEETHRRDACATGAEETHRRDACATETQSARAPESGTSERPGTGSSPGVDLYLGGSEHAVGHLLYSRFWQNVLFDLGEVSTPEPFHKLFHQGLITSYAYQRADKSIVPTDEVREVAENTFEHAPTGERVTPVVTKMSKRYKNVVNPDDVIAEFGADTFRLYEMYMGPLEASKPWNTRDIPGLFRFLARLWRLVIDEESGALVLGEAPDAEIEKLLHRLGAKVEQDIARLAFNTAIAACIEFVNAATSAREKRSARLTPAQARRLALIICPLAPHIAEELWAKAEGAGLASDQRWPEADPALLRDDEVEIAVQIQGKVRQRLRVPAGADAATVEALVMADAEVQKHLAGKTVKKVVVVPGRMVNIVAG